MEALCASSTATLVRLNGRLAPDGSTALFERLDAIIKALPSRATRAQTRKALKQLDDEPTAAALLADDADADGFSLTIYPEGND